MTPEERAVITAALRWHRMQVENHSALANRSAYGHLLFATQALKISRQPEHTVEPIPCGVYSSNSATMFCILQKGHPDRGYYSHVGYPGGVRGAGPNGGARPFHYEPYYESMETHNRAACPRFPGCTRHPAR